MVYFTALRSKESTYELFHPYLFPYEDRVSQPPDPALPAARTKTDAPHRRVKYSAVDLINAADRSPRLSAASAGAAL